MRYRSIVLPALVLCLSLCMTPDPVGAAQKRVTQGEYAVALAKKLDIAEAPSVAEAVGQLEDLGVEPDEGWKPDGKMTSELVEQIYRRLVDAVEEGNLDFSVDELKRMLRDLSVSFDLPFPSKLPRRSSAPPAPSPSSIGVGGGGGASVSE